MARMPSPSHYDRLASAIESVKASDPHWRNPERAVRSTLLILLLSPGGVRPSTMSGATVLAALEKVGLASEDKKSYRYTKTTAAQKFGIAKDFTQKEREEAADELGDSPGHSGGDPLLRFPEGLMTERDWVQKHADRITASTVYWRDLIDRTKWNRMDGDEQALYSKRLEARSRKPQYRAWKGDRFHVISAATHAWAVTHKFRGTSGRAAGKLSKAETTKKGAHGTLHLYVIRYYDTSERGNEWTTRKWAYDEEHARQKFYDGDSDGWAIESVKRA